MMGTGGKLIKSKLCNAGVPHVAVVASTAKQNQYRSYNKLVFGEFLTAIVHTVTTA
jgi:hypothetical protein